MANLDSSCSSITPFGAGIITLAIYGRLLHHITLSKSFDLLSTTPSYDFWSEHWRISQLFGQWSACLSHDLSLANAGTDPSIISLHLNTWAISLGQNDVAAVIIERTGCSQAMLQDCQSNSLVAAASIANLIRSAIKANFSFTRVSIIYQVSDHLVCLRSLFSWIPGSLGAYIWHLWPALALFVGHLVTYPSCQIWRYFLRDFRNSSQWHHALTPWSR